MPQVTAVDDRFGTHRSVDAVSAVGHPQPLITTRAHMATICDVPLDTAEGGRMRPNEAPTNRPPWAGGQGQVPEPDNWWLSESPGRPRWRPRPLKLGSARLRPWATLRWPISRQAGLTSGALVVAGGIAALAFVAFDSHDKSPPPVVTANTQAVAPVAPAQTTHTASPALTALPPPASPPAAGPTTGRVPAPATQSDHDTATSQAKAAEAAAVPRPVVVQHHASSPIRHQPSRPRPATPAPDTGPAPASPPPAAEPEQQSQSKYRWEKTTTCDETGRCTHHYNIEPNTDNGQPATPRDQGP